LILIYKPYLKNINGCWIHKNPLEVFI
jgi:hypothetical protein